MQGVDPTQIELATTTALTLSGTYVLRKFLGERMDKPEFARALHFWGSGVIAVVSGLAAEWAMGTFSPVGGVGKALVAWFFAQGLRRFKKGAGIA